MDQSEVKLLDSESFEKVKENRRSATYKPNIWKYDFLQSLASEYDKEEFGMQLDKRATKVKGLFVQEMSLLEKLELVDWIQKLGLANHFHKEINEFLETIFVSVKNSNNPTVQENLHVTALCFKLLRQHGSQVLPDILGNFLDEKGIIVMRKSSFAGDAKDLLGLLEASHIGLEGEKILDDAKTFAINSLKGAFTPSSININSHSNLVERVIHAMELPSHWRVKWFDVKWHVKQYEKEKHMDQNLLELAKLNFNIVQAKLQTEIKELSRWWENLGIKKKLSFARNRLVECFMCAAGVAFEPKYKSLRKWLTKVIIFVLLIDDVYDIYASFEELKPFTMAFDRWDAKELEQLPEYMRICFNALNDVTNETAYEIAGEENFNIVLPYLKKAAERERGDAASSILCYMNEMEVSEEEARKHIQDMINNAWKEINGHCSTRVASVEPFLTQARNAARVAHTLYQNGDGFGIQDRDIKNHILSLVIERL